MTTLTLDRKKETGQNPRVRFKETDPLKQFEFTSCDNCGKCFSECPYMSLPESQAKAEIQRLKYGTKSIVTDRCMGCMTCVAKCPNKCNPYSLIRARRHEAYNRDGLPEVARVMMPHESQNFRSAVRHTKAEKEYLRKIAEPPEADTILYTGCNALMYPEILQSGIFSDLPPYGAFDYCCGEMYHRMGLYDSARQSGVKLQNALNRTRAKKVVFICVACMHMTSKILPDEFGLNFAFEKQFLASWLLERIESGELEIRKPIKAKVTVQDTCHAKVFGDRIYDDTRKLIKILGAEIVEMKHTKQESLCCGIAAGCSRFSPVDVVSAGFRRTHEATMTGADSTITVCNGCQMAMNIMRVFQPWAPPLVPLVQLVQQAAGEQPNLNISMERSQQMLAGVALQAAPKLLSRNRFFMKPIV